MEPKSLLASKTFWFNVLGAAATIGGVFGVDMGLDAETKAQIAAGLMALGNVILRCITQQPIKRPKMKKE